MSRKITRIEQIVAEAASGGGRAHVRVGNGTPVAELWFDGATLVAATSEGSEVRLGARLVSTGNLARTELERAHTAAQRGGASFAAALARDEARYALAAALAAPAGEVAVGAGDPPDDSFTVALDALDLLAETKEFLAAVRDAHRIAPPDARPIATESPAPDLALEPEEWAILSRADGTTTIRRLAEECGFPQPEASLIVKRLSDLGLVAVEASMSDAAGLIAELEAAEDLAAITAAFEHAAIPAPEYEEAIVELPPLVLDEAPAAPRIDTQALLRELSSIARQPATRNS